MLSDEDDKKVRTLTLKDVMSLIRDKYNIGENGEELRNLANNILYDFYANRVELKEGARDF